MRFFAATLLLLLAFAAAEDKPAHCRFPKPSESAIGELNAAGRICREQGDDCDVHNCILEVLDMLDDDGNVKPKEMVDFFMPGEGYEETKEFIVETIAHCIETGAGYAPEGCQFNKSYKTTSCLSEEMFDECGSA